MDLGPLKKLVENKTVAYVCPGQHLIGKGIGSKIDSYDIVIRVNQYFAIPEERKKDYGSRMDIVFGAFNICNIKECKENWSFFQGNKELKAAVVAMCHDQETINFKKYFEETLKIPFVIPVREELRHPVSDVGTVVNSGMIGLILLRECNPKKVFVTGMNFYNMGKYGDVYFNEHYDSITSGTGLRQQFIPNKNKVVTPKNSRWDLHNIHKQIIFCQKIIKENQNLFELDFYLEENLFKYNKKVIAMIIDNGEANLKEYVKMIKTTQSFEDIYISSTDITHEKIAKEKGVKFYQRSKELYPDEVILDFVDNVECSHVVYISPKLPVASFYEIRIFTNFLMAYNLDLVISTKKDPGSRSSEILQKQLSSSNLYAWKVSKFKENKENHTDKYNTDAIKTAYFLLDNLDHKNVPKVDITKSLELDMIYKKAT